MQLGCIDWHWLRGAHASGLRRGSCSRKRHRGHRREASSLCPHRIMQFNDLNTVAFRRLPHLLTLRPHPFMPTFKRHPHRHPRRYDRRHRRQYELPRNHLLYGEKKEGTCNKSWKQTCTLGVNPSQSFMRSCSLSFSFFSLSRSLRRKQIVSFAMRFSSSAVGR